VYKRQLSNEKQLQASIDRHPLKKIGKPEDIASLVSWLVSENSEFVTGQIFNVDGGMSSVR